MASDATLLALIDAVITKRLNGDAYESYSEAELSYRGTSLKDLFAIRAGLTQGSSSAFSLAAFSRSR